MLEQWLDHVNLFLHAHPYWMAKLAFLFRLKCGLLTLLAGYFLFLLYREQSTKRADERGKAPARFLA